MNATYSHSNRAQEKKWGTIFCISGPIQELSNDIFTEPTNIGHVKEIANNSVVMPRKSTYFYPKVFSGLVFSKIEPHEIVQVY